MSELSAAVVYTTHFCKVGEFVRQKVYAIPRLTQGCCDAPLCKFILSKRERDERSMLTASALSRGDGIEHTR